MPPVPLSPVEDRLLHGGDVLRIGTTVPVLVQGAQLAHRVGRRPHNRVMEALARPGRLAYHGVLHKVLLGWNGLGGQEVESLAAVPLRRT